MRLIEFVQRAEDGGYPVPNEGPFFHGEPVVVLSTRELAALAKRALVNLDNGKDRWLVGELERLKALGDNFVVPV